MKTYSVIVCYNPEVTNLFLLCQVLINSHSAIVIIDNTEESYISKYESFPNCTLVPLGENTGIAHAQNIGIKHAIKGGADVIVFFDQDSKIENDFLSNLLAPLETGEPRVVAPVLLDNDKVVKEFGTMTAEYVFSKYDWDIVVDRYEELYESIIAR